MSLPQSSFAEDQAKLLAEAQNMVKQEAFYMKRAMDEDDLKMSLKHCSSMLNELRTGLLTPKNYYELYMSVFDEMRYLESFISECNKKGTPMVDLYEMVIR